MIHLPRNSVCFGLLFLAASVCLVHTGEVHAAKPEHVWKRWRGAEGRNISPVTGIRKNWNQQPPKLVWMAEGIGEGYASVSVADGRVYTTGNLGDQGQGVIAVNDADGSVIWTTVLTEKPPKHGYQGSRCTPTIDGDRLYVVTSDGQIACLKLSDGEVLWQRSFKEFGGKMMSGWGYSESPLIDGDWVLCTPGGQDAMIVALNKLDGKTVWQSAVPNFGPKKSQKGKSIKRGAGYSSLRISHGAGVKQYVQLIGQGLIGVRASDGKFLWGYGKVANGTANIPTPLIAGDYVFASTGYQTGSALVKLSPEGDGVKAEEQYFLNAKTLQNHHGGMVLIGDHVYCGNKHGNGFPTCLNWKEGKIVWGGEMRGPGSGSAAITYLDGSIIFRYQNGTVALIEATPKEYNLQGTFQPAFTEGRNWAHPVAVNGRLYLRQGDKLMCYALK